MTDSSDQDTNKREIYLIMSVLGIGLRGKNHLLNSDTRKQISLRHVRCRCSVSEEIQYVIYNKIHNILAQRCYIIYHFATDIKY